MANHNENNGNDSAVLSHIKSLTAREEHLYGKENLTDADINELHKVKLELDQYWDLLRQRRAFRDAGENPDNASARDEVTLESYDNFDED